MAGFIDTHPDLGKVAEVAYSYSQFRGEKKDPTNPLHAGKSITEPVLSVLTGNYYSEQLSTIPALSPAHALHRVQQEWERENQQSGRFEPRLVWVWSGQDWILCTAFPYHHPGNSELGPALIIVDSAISESWLATMQMHPQAEQKDSILNTAILLTLFAGYEQQAIVEQYQAGCDQQGARSIFQAMGTFSHSDGPFTIMLSAATQQQPGKLARLIGSNPSANMHAVAHAHNLAQGRSQEIAQAALGTGLLGGMDTKIFAYVPSAGVNDGQLLEKIIGVPVLPTTTEMAFLKQQHTQGASLRLPLSPENATLLPATLRHFGLGAELSAEQIVRFEQRARQEGTDSPTSMVDIALLSL